MISYADRCKTCDGKGYQEEKNVVLPVEILPGMEYGQVVTLEGKGDFAPNSEPVRFSFSFFVFLCFFSNY